MKRLFRVSTVFVLLLCIATALFAVSPAEEAMIIERLKSDKSLQGVSKGKTLLKNPITEQSMQSINIADDSNSSLDINKTLSRDANASGIKALYYEKFMPFAYEDQLSLIEKLEKATPAIASPIALGSLKRFGASFFENKKNEYLTNIPVPDNYILSTGDMINLSIYGAENSDNQIQIDRDGNINIPKVGVMKIGGLEYSSAKSLLESKLKALYPNSTIVLAVGDLRSSTVTVAGEVKRPGNYTLNALAKVKDALIAAGGISDVGSMRSVEVLRNGKVVAKFDLYKLIRGGKNKGDVVLRAGDVVHVPVAKTLVEFDGAVKIPAIYELTDGENIQDLIKYAGGMSSNAVKVLKVEKSDGDKKIIIEVSVNDKTQLSDGDKVFTERLADLSKNSVFLKGNVYPKTALEISKTETLSSLVKKQIKILGADGLFMPDTDMSYFLIKRINSGSTSYEVLSGNLELALNGDSRADVSLKAQDQIFILNNSLTEDIKFVTVDGEVIRGGKFKYFRGMKLIDAIKSAGLKQASDTAKISVISQDANKSLSVVAYSMDEADRVALRAYDKITIDNFFKTKEMPSIKISGGVNQAVDFNTTKAIKLGELINYARGLSPRASKESFELTSYYVENGVRKTKISKHSLIEAIDSGMLIEPYNEVRIHQIANWDSNRSVRLDGQVKFPGEYSVAPGEKLSSVIDRAGGFLPSAFIEGAVFSRVDIKKMQQDALKKQIVELDSKITYLATQSSAAGEKAEEKAMMIKSLEGVKNNAKDIEVVGRVSIKLDRDLDKFAKSYDNVVLKPGDRLVVPEAEDSILIIGEVMNSTAVTYKSDEDVMGYIVRAGGLRDTADEDAIFLIRANGESEKVKRSYMLGVGSSNVKKGDTIVVPLKVSTYSGMQFAKDITGILYQMAVSAAALKTVGGL